MSDKPTKKQQAVMDCIGMTPYDAMLKVLNSERYSAVRIAEA